MTDRSVTVTWATAARDRSGRLRPVVADTEVRMADAETGAPLPRHTDSRPTAYHYAEISGLEPGRTYRFEAYSDGVRAVPGRTLVTRRSGSPESTGRFTTATPPPGRLLRTIALANDVHFGEQRSGILLAGLPIGLRHEPEDHPAFMLGALLDDLRLPDRAADHLIVAGDLTDNGTAEESRAIRERFDSWGVLGRDYFVCRGNHDTTPADQPDHWGEVFHPFQQLAEYFLGGLRVIALDTARRGRSGGTLEAAQLEHLRDLLVADPDRPTLIFGHHPVTSHAAVSNPAGPGFVLDRTSAAALTDIYRCAPGVFLHHSGHTHRNRRNRPDPGVAVEFLEVGAAKEYPGGYTMLRIYEGGYTANFYKTRSEAARRWSARTRKQYLGMHPDHALGTCADRNHVVHRDFTALNPA
ncbi:metallophosphoesterase [Nocardia sp. NPDC051030]|uniref:metallophosphoesterase n=1 Tax=Nocardia sp. NPDC051030 TaxID=3155162 RepID=UPI00342E4BD1